MTDELIIEDGVVALKNDFYLKLDAGADMPSVLSAFYKQDYSTIVDPETGVESTQIEGEPYFVSSTADYAIDVVGVLHEPTGNTLTDDGMEYPEMQALDGWHVAHRAASINSGNLDVDIGAGSRGAPSELVKFAIGFSDNNFAASLNGATAVTDTSVTIPSGLSKLALGYFYDNFQGNFAAVNGHIKSIQYYPRQLTNTQLQELTT